MKKFLAALAVLFAFCTMLSLSAFAADRVLNVYNWGEYISDGSEGSLDVNAEFEKWYAETYGETVKVVYTTYASNEDLYAKLKSGAAGYDVILPSDYMIARMIEEGMLEKLNFDNIPNYTGISESFRGLYYDANDESLHSMAEAYTRIYINTCLSNKVEVLLNIMEKGKIDGTIYHLNRSCKLMSFLNVETAEIIKEANGKPYVSFDGDQTDPNVYSEAQYETRVQALVEMMEANLAEA